MNSIPAKKRKEYFTKVLAEILKIRQEAFVENSIFCLDSLEGVGDVVNAVTDQIRVRIAQMGLATMNSANVVNPSPIHHDLDLEK